MTYDPWPHLLSRIDQRGWAMQSVLSDEASPMFSYTIGLSKKKLPELLVVGLFPEQAQQLLDVAVRRHVVERFKGETGELLQGILTIPIAPRKASSELAKEAALFASDFAEAIKSRFEFIQLVLPDRAGLFPWDSGYDAAMHRAQKLFLASNSEERLELPKAITDIVDGAATKKRRASRRRQ